MCVNDRFSKSFKTYLGRDAIHNFLNPMIEECNYCIEVMKKHFNKELVMTKDNEEFRTLLNVGSVTIIRLKMMLKQEIMSYYWKM